MNNPISVSFNFCSNDEEFIDKCIDEASKFSDDINVSFMDKFFDGAPENLELIDKVILRNQGKAVFRMTPWRGDLLAEAKHPWYFYKFCHNSHRWNNVQNCKHDYILFLDSDAIPEGDRVKEWIDSIKIDDFNSYFFNIYSYVRSKKFQIKDWHEAVAVMSRRELLTREQVFSLEEIQALLTPPSSRNVKGLDGKPMFHHFGWARGNDEEECKQKLLRKVASWGHTFDKNWKDVLDEEFSRPPNGQMHGWEYNILP